MVSLNELIGSRLSHNEWRNILVFLNKREVDNEKISYKVLANGCKGDSFLKCFTHLYFPKITRREIVLFFENEFEKRYSPIFDDIREVSKSYRAFKDRDFSNNEEVLSSDRDDYVNLVDTSTKGLISCPEDINRFLKDISYLLHLLHETNADENTWQLPVGESEYLQFVKDKHFDILKHVELLENIDTSQ